MGGPEFSLTDAFTGRRDLDTKRHPGTCVQRKAARRWPCESHAGFLTRNQTP